MALRSPILDRDDPFTHKANRAVLSVTPVSWYSLKVSVRVESFIAYDWSYRLAVTTAVGDCGGAGDVRVIGEPLALEHSVDEAVDIRNSRNVGRHNLARPLVFRRPASGLRPGCLRGIAGRRQASFQITHIGIE